MVEWWLLILRETLHYELCPFPASLCDSYGHMRNPDTKLLLVKPLADTREKPDIEMIIDEALIQYNKIQYKIFYSYETSVEVWENYRLVAMG